MSSTSSTVATPTTLARLPRRLVIVGDSTAGAVARVGAVPVVADVRAALPLLGPAALPLRPRTRAVIAAYSPMRRVLCTQRGLGGKVETSTTAALVTAAIAATPRAAREGR